MVLLLYGVCKQGKTRIGNIRSELVLCVSSACLLRRPDGQCQTRRRALNAESIFGQNVSYWEEWIKLFYDIIEHFCINLEREMNVRIIDLWPRRRRSCSQSLEHKRRSSRRIMRENHQEGESSRRRIMEENHLAIESSSRRHQGGRQSVVGHSFRWTFSSLGIHGVKRLAWVWLRRVGPTTQLWAQYY